ncbi:Chlorovirus glycoprotein repeat domain-containing protein [Only Syngen Nebraska virus 5]|uniref:Chlorovirus glycoprotein repeat domain-containing protein n=1 Tax=Only Syngen Nebraska virus 5 TaxID=1917232 RepID=UPI000900B67E|nr:Chlorovirus glycoprotein repeat domain-containing protein [Only Syngen Nebraska virus 5]APC25594.1 Chlorovirus glycoprotein repeat domain-containing protein [Only Syngen Nebraska virus 5]
MSSAQFKTYINKLAGINTETGDYDIFGNIVVEGNGSVIRGASNLSPISNTDISGNLLGNFVSVSNVISRSGFFVGDGTFITGTSSASIPDVSRTNVVGNLTGTSATMAGNITANYFFGDGSGLTGLVTTIPRSGNININGNIFATANVDAANISTGLLRVNGNMTISQQFVGSGNITANYFIGDGSRIYGINASPPTVANLNIVGNVSASGNVDASNVTANILTAGNISVSGSLTAGNITAAYFIGNGSNLTSLIPTVVSTDIIGNVTAAGNIRANYFLGNAFNMSFSGNLVTIQGNVANQAARLALTGVPLGGLVTQTDTNSQYLLAYNPPSINTNWVPLAGTNFPVTSAFGRQGDVVLISGVDIKTLGGTPIVGTGDIKSANIDVIGNVTGNVQTVLFTTAGNTIANVITATGQVYASGNIFASKFIGNGFYLVGTFAPIPATGNINIMGNVVAAGNVNATNVSTTLLRVRGNVAIGTFANVIGNIVTSGYFYGDGSRIINAAVGNATGTRSIDIVGNVTAPSFVDASNISANVFRVNGNLIVTQQIITTGNTTANFLFGDGSTITGVTSVFGTQNINITGNVNAPANVNASNVTANLLRVNGNANVIGQVIVVGNVSAQFFIGNGSRITNVFASGTQIVNIDGNVSAPANVNSANVTTSLLGLYGNSFVSGQVDVSGNIFASFFVGNGSRLTGVVSTLTGTQAINIVGNVLASGNVDAANISSGLVRVNANTIVTGQVNVIGNVTANFFVGNGSRVSNVVLLGLQSINVNGNVRAPANVNASNVTASSAFINGNVTNTGQVNVSGTVAGNFLLGNGFRLTNVVASAGVPASFIEPQTGFLSNVTTVASYGVILVNSWMITLNVSTPRFLTIRTTTLPPNPNAPFTTLPAGVTQTLANAWVYTSGIWQGTVRLTAASTFSEVSNNLVMNYHTSFGTYNGFSSETYCRALP